MGNYILGRWPRSRWLRSSPGLSHKKRWWELAGLDWNLKMGTCQMFSFLACVASLIFFTQVSESSWSHTESFLMFSSLACYPCSAEIEDSAVPNSSNITWTRWRILSPAATTPTPPLKVLIVIVVFSVADGFCSSCAQFVKNTKTCPGSHAVVVCTEWDEFKTLDWEKVPADYHPLNVIRKSHHIFRSSYDINSSNFCVPMLSI